MTLTRKLVLSYLAVVLTSGAALVLAADRLLSARLTQEAAKELEREAAYLAGAVPHVRGPSLDSLLAGIAAATGRRLTVIDPAGVPIADSDFPGAAVSQLENHRNRPEFREALAGRTGHDYRLSVSTGRWELKVAVPMPGGAVRVSAPVPQVAALVQAAQTAVLLGALAATVVGALLAIGFGRSVARPLVTLRNAAQAIARGDRVTVDVRGRGEVGDLARALRDLEEHLGRRLAELEHERSETAALVAAMVEGVIACDARGTVVAANPSARRILGFREDEPLPAVLELFRPRAAHDAVAGALQGRTAQSLEVEIGSRTSLLSVQPLGDGGVLLVLHDLTAVRRLETIRRDFVANVSHELKTPLTVVRGYAETLLADDPGGEVRRTFLQAVLTNAGRMQRLVDDLLDLSRIESGVWRPEPQAQDLAAVAHEVWIEVTRASDPSAPRLRVDLATGAGTVEADPQGLRQILRNVLENAARYASPGGTVWVRSRRDGEMVAVEIADSGPGIPTEHLERIFERFYRVDPARSREMGGTGLGLAIVKHLVEAHGGSVVAESQLGVGTTIRFALPASPGDDGPPPVTES